MRASRSLLGWQCGAALVVASAFASACGGGEAPEAEPVIESVGAVATADPEADTASALQRFLPDEMRRSTRPETFAHGAHIRIDCAVCHQLPRGHGSHADVGCASCHRASAQATLTTLSPEQCQSCHHGAEQTWTCEHCHETRTTRASVQELAFDVWSAPRTRTLAFDHGAHADLDCASCHRAMPALTPAESCASCHDDHMEAQIRCVACHTPSTIAVHDVEAHLTCSGAGCHSAPIVEAMASTRPVCLLCHQAQEEHEPGGNCIECHRVRPGGAGGLGL